MPAFAGAYDGLLKFDERSIITAGGSNHRDVVLAGAGTTLRFRLNHVPSGNWVDYDAATTTLEVRVAETPVRPAAPNLPRVVDIRALMGAPRAHFGFSSATAQAFGDHDMRCG